MNVFRAGDGTTTSTLLTQEIVNQGMRLVTSGANPVELRQGILAASGMIIEEIKRLAVPVKQNEVRCRGTFFLSFDWYDIRMFQVSRTAVTLAGRASITAKTLTTRGATDRC